MDVIPVAEARAGLSRLLADLRVNDDLTVVIGAHRRPEAAMLSFDRYQQLLSAGAQPGVTLSRLRELGPVIERLAAASHLSNVHVYGSVARGESNATSDVDLLVTPDADASLFDLAQLELDLELILGVPVSVASRRALREGEDDRILGEALPL